jgi:ribonuclease HI
MTMKATILFDGGCRGNPGRMYGSYKILLPGGIKHEEDRFDLGEGTNNVAEFLSLHKALDAFVSRFNPDLYDLMVHTDSTIVRNRLMGKNRIHKKPQWRDRSAVMFHLANECLMILRKFQSFRVEWHSRDNNISVFGH